MDRTEHWPVPYSSKLEGQFNPGQTLIIKGLVTGERFDINLQTGKDEVALHISVRAKEKAIVLNSKKAGAWEKEERIKDPFKDGEPFDLRVRAHESKFEIFANQKEVATFDYRQALSNITHLTIDGTVQLHNVSWGGKYYPVPYQIKIDGGLKSGKRLFVSGVPDKNAKRFHVNLVTQSGDTALHFNVRFDDKAVVRNSQIGGTWQAEERQGKFTFQKDHGFDLIIVNDAQAFQLYVDGQKIGEFVHRTDPNSIAGLLIEGDLELQGVHVK